MKRDFGKQCRPRSDATEHGVWLGSTLFAIRTGGAINMVTIKTNQTLLIFGNKPVKILNVEESTRHKRVTFWKYAYSNKFKNFTIKNWKFSDKNLKYFSYFCSKHRLWVLVRTASPWIYVFEQKQENNVYPFKPQFYYIKGGLRGSKLYKHVFVMIFLSTLQYTYMWYLLRQEGVSFWRYFFAQIMPKFWSLPHLNWEFSYIFFTFVKNLPHHNGIFPSYS